MRAWRRRLVRRHVGDPAVRTSNVYRYSGPNTTSCRIRITGTVHAVTNNGRDASQGSSTTRPHVLPGWWSAGSYKPSRMSVEEPSGWPDPRSVAGNRS